MANNDHAENVLISEFRTLMERMGRNIEEIKRNYEKIQQVIAALNQMDGEQK